MANMKAFWIKPGGVCFGGPKADILVADRSTLIIVVALAQERLLNWLRLPVAG